MERLSQMRILGWSAAVMLITSVACSAGPNASGGRMPGAAQGVSGAGGAAVGGQALGGRGAGAGDFGNSIGTIPVTSSPTAGTAASAGAGGAAQVRREDCGTLKMIVRDFSPATHPDFERTPFSLDNILSIGQGEKKLVKPQLEKGFPAYAYAGTSPGNTVEGPASYYQWYVDDPRVNMRFEISLPFTEISPGRFVYDSAAFFPIDNMGFGNEGNQHNYHFTTEARTKFTYAGGEVFTFRGDDDLWLFVNGQLVIDLGGMHGPLQADVNLDAEASRLGLVRGETYPMDIFHAERHTVDSNYRIETNIDCFVPVVPPPPPPPPMLN